MQEGAARATLTLAAAKAALQKWQGHMRRGAQLQNEAEYAAALALVPMLPQPAAYQARTLRALADLYRATNRWDEAAGLFERIAQGGGRLSEIFWRDYAELLFKLGLRRLGAGQVALANQALIAAGQLLERPDFDAATGSSAGDEARLAALDGYGETALWFERAGELAPAALYAERCLDLAARLQAWAPAAGWLRRLAQSGAQRAGSQRALVWLDRLQGLQALGYPEALAQAAQAAGQLAQAEMSLGRREGAQLLYQRTEAWLKAAGGEESLALADLYLGWGLALNGTEGRPYLEQALSLRRRLLGPQHARTREAEQAVGGLGGVRAPAGTTDGTPQAWDGGSQFQAEGPSFAAEAKRLHRRLARLCHPDGAQDPTEAEQRHQWMVKINAAAAVGDVLSLRMMMREVLAGLAEARKKEG